MTDKTPPPSIRSYALRRGRITKAQYRAWARHADAYLIDASAPPPRWEDIFRRRAPLVVEIGSGDGAATAALAAAHPHNDYVAFEVYRPGVGALLNRLAATALNNVRIVAADAALHLPLMFSDGALTGVNIFFPDPWRKKRHHKRRLIQPPFAAMLASRLGGGGFVHFATDWRDYAEHAAAVFSANRSFQPMPPPPRPPTKFERRAELPTTELFYRRV